MSGRRRLDPASLPGPENVTDVRLPNGLRALVRANDTSPAVVVEGVLLGGALLEPPDRPGLAAFAVELLERGTARHDFAALSDELEAVGAEVGFGAGRHTASFDAKCLSEDLPMVLDRMADMLTEPSFPHEQVELVRGQLLTALAQRRSSTRYRAHAAFRALAYGPDHPYGRDPDGSPESVAALSRDELAAFYHSVFHPDGGIVVVVGAIDPAAAVDLLSGTLGRWQPGHPPPPRPVVTAPALADHRRETRIELPGKTQADIVLGNPAIARAHPDWLAAGVANAVLGVFGLMGRLGRNVRDARGLAYYAYSHLAGGLGPGPWMAAAGVNPSDVDECLAAVLAEMRRLRDEAVPADELADVKAFLTGSLPLRLETNDGVAASLADIALHDLGLDYLQRYSQYVDALDAADVQAAAQRHLHPDTAAVAVAGPPVAGGGPGA